MSTIDKVGLTQSSGKSSESKPLKKSERAQASPAAETDVKPELGDIAQAQALLESLSKSIDSNTVDAQTGGLDEERIMRLLNDE